MMTQKFFNSTILGGLTASFLGLSAFGALAADLDVGVVRSGAFGPVEVHRNPGDAVTLVSNQGAVFEGLVTVLPEGGIKLQLAQSIEPEDSEGKVWIIKLRAGVKFHDGSEMTSADVAYSLERMTREGMIPAGMVGPVEKIEAVDPLTVRLTLKAPKTWVADGLSDPFAAVVKAGYEPGQDPIGTGPFKIAGMETQKSVVLEKFADYYGTPAASDKITVHFFSESQAGLNAIQNEQIDMLIDFDVALAEEIEGNEALKLYNSPTGMTYPIQMRNDVAPYNDPRLRKALRLVVDREMVVQNAYNGYATVASDLYARADGAFRADLKRERNVDEAKALIEEAGLSGTTLQLVTKDDPAMALVVAENAREIGLNIEVSQVDSATFYNDEYMQRSFFGGDYWPPMSFLATSAMVDAPNASFGQIRWQDEEYFKLWEVANATLDADEKAKALADLQQILFDRGSWLIPAYPNELIIFNAAVEGMPDSDVWGRAGYRHLAKLFEKSE